jgi:hypothetical protein
MLEQARWRQSGFLQRQLQAVPPAFDEALQQLARVALGLDQDAAAERARLEGCARVLVPLVPILGLYGVQQRRVFVDDLEPFDVQR